MNDLSTQQEQILKIVKKIGPSKANQIIEEYNQDTPDNAANVYEQLNRLKAKGYIKKQDRLYIPVINPNTQSGGLLNPKEIAEIQDYAQDPYLLDKIGTDFNPQLINLNDIKLLAFCVITSEMDSFGDKNRMHMLLEGEPSSGKSTLIETAYTQYGGIFVDPETSKIGLIGSVQKSTYTPGALALADQNTLYIDELDKFSSEEQTGLLQALESGKIRINKDGVHKEVLARVRVIATCNNQQKIIEPLRSRFDIIKKLPKFDIEEQKEILSNQFQEWGQPKHAIKDLEFFKKYMEYAINHKTSLPNPNTEEREKLRAIYLNEVTSPTSQLFTKTTRQKTTPIRLAHTIAKAKLHPTITTDDLKTALNLIR